MGWFEDRFPELVNVKVNFGLRAQGHLPTVEKMLAEGKTWKEIGKAIGWDADTAKEYYALESGGR